MSIKSFFIATVAISFMACACTNKTARSSNTVEAYQKVSPDFNSDSAYSYIQKQVDFGPRVPNSTGHVACGDYLVSELKRMGASVQEQKMVLTAYDGTKLNSRNIIASYYPEKKTRILLFAHWDTRPFSDHDANPENHRKPLLGANDGASGVGVLLEIARVINQTAPETEVDIIFFDAEDYGVPSFEKNMSSNDSWCLGSQYWAKNPHIPNYKAKFGILLDMVGAPNARFDRDSVSMEYAKGVVEKIWSAARQLGYGQYYVTNDACSIMDDHVPVNTIRRIPSVDIIHCDPNSETGFAAYWHTQNDDMTNISKETLKAVGQTVLEVIYKEK